MFQKGELMKEYTQEEVVELEGDDVLKKHLRKNKRLTTNMFIRFEKDLKQIYGDSGVIIKGRGGQKTKYYLSERLEYPILREDGRSNNGKKQVPESITKGISIMILRFLMRNDTSSNRYTITRWLDKMGIISESLFKANKIKYKKNLLESELRNVNEQNHFLDYEDINVLMDYISREIKRIQKQFMKELDSLAQKSIIYFDSLKMAKVSIESYDYLTEVKEHILLTPYELDQIEKIKEKIKSKDKYKTLTEKEIHIYKNKSLVKEFWTDYNEELSKVENKYQERLYIEYVYDTYVINLLCDKDAILESLDGNEEDISLYNENDIKFISDAKSLLYASLDKYICSLSLSREESFIAQEKKLVMEHGGKINKRKYDGNPFEKNKELMINKRYSCLYNQVHNHYKKVL